MVQFLVKRFIGLIFVVISVTFITFILGYFAPGDPIRALLGQHFDPQTYAQLRQQYRLDLPWYEQYYHYMLSLLHLDFGYSIHYQGETIWDMLKSRVPVSLELGAWGLLLTLLIGIPLGIISALRANTWLDTTTMAFLLILYALPSFVLAVLVQMLIIWLYKWTGTAWPVANWGTPWQYSWNDIQYKLAPILVYAGTSFAFYARLARTSMLEVLRQDYVRTARAKGLLEKFVISRHALRNAIIPLITVIGVATGFLFVGVFFIEQIFNIPGIGSTALQAISNRDYPVIQATTILGATTVVMGNLIADIFYSLADPRIKAQ
jgi:peptide/nickel transport system permease protein/oligopeptide transport system permease protein